MRGYEMEDRLKRIFSDVLNIPAEEISETISMDTVEEWDSIKHLSLILALEQEFSISILPEDSMVMSNYLLVLAILVESYLD